MIRRYFYLDDNLTLRLLDAVVFRAIADWLKLRSRNERPPPLQAIKGWILDEIVTGTQRPLLWEAGAAIGKVIAHFVFVGSDGAIVIFSSQAAGGNGRHPLGWIFDFTQGRGLAIFSVFSEL